MPAVDLREAVRVQGRIEGDLVKVDDFLNHRVDAGVMRKIGADMASLLAAHRPNMLLTAEASGIPPALTCALAMDLPMVYAKKYLGTGDRYSYAREVTSPTKGVEYRVEVARRVVTPGSRVAIVDDILSRGRTAEALGEIVEEAGCEVSAFVFALEKSFMDGRQRLESHGWTVYSLVDVASIADRVIELNPT